MKIKTSELTGLSLRYAVAVAEGYGRFEADEGEYYFHSRNSEVGWFLTLSDYKPDENWEQGGPILESANITVIRANDDYEKDDQGFTSSKRVPVWFAECDQWVGHSLCTSYEGENMEPSFIIGEGGGYYGPTPLVAAMRAYIALKLGDEVEIPDALVR